MKKITEELLGSQRRVTKKIGDPKILKKVRKLFRKINRKRHVVQVNNLYINVQEICEGNMRRKCISYPEYLEQIYRGNQVNKRE